MEDGDGSPDGSADCWTHPQPQPASSCTDQRALLVGSVVTGRGGMFYIGLHLNLPEGVSPFREADVDHPDLSERTINKGEIIAADRSKPVKNYLCVAL